MQTHVQGLRNSTKYDEQSTATKNIPQLKQKLHGNTDYTQNTFWLI